MKPRFHLRNMLFAAFLIVVAIPLAFQSYFHLAEHGRDQRRTAGGRLREAAAGISASVDDYIERHRAAVGNTAGGVEAGGRFDPAILRATLQRTRAHHSGFRTMLVADETGLIIAADPAGPAEGPSVVGNSVADRDYYQEAIRLQQTYVSSAFLGRGFGGDPIVAVSRAFRGPGGKTYVLEGSLDLAKFRMFENRYATLESAPLIIADTAHRVVYASPRLGEPVLKDISQSPITEMGHRHADTTFEIPDPRGPLLMAHTTTAAAGWHVYIGQPLAVIQQERSQYLRLTLMVALIALLVSLGLAQWLSVKVSRPVEHLVHALHEFFASGTPEPVRLPRFVPVEIRALSDAYDGMSARLTKVLSGLLPVCAWCKKIRNDRQEWEPMEAYITRETEAKPTHGMCPDCARKHFPEESSRVSKNVP